MSGPVPNRSEDLARPRERKGGDAKPVTAGELRAVTIPRADPEWHPIARKIWDGMKTSGQADFYQNSDWAFAYSLMDDLSKQKRSGKPSAVMFQTIYSQLASLGLTEGERRRMRIELSAPDDGAGNAELYAIEDYKNSLGVE